MKLITYEYRKDEQVGVLNRSEDAVYPAACAKVAYASMLELIQKASQEELARLRQLAETPRKAVSNAIDRNAIRLLAPIPHPAQDVICLGINYREHAEEAKSFHPDAFDEKRPCTIYFSKRVDRAVADGEPVPAHRDLVDSLDYEAELAVIIGRDASRVKKQDAADYIFGYTVLNDISARNVQTGHKQWYFGKSLDGFTPIGPCIATVDAFACPPALKITATVNGELRQNSVTSLLITGIAEVISELSQGMTLRAGTILSMGTPSGVGMGFRPPKFLKPGDVVTCSVEGIGSLTNPISD
jgi:2-keto-4-pentenoate hydratase/2-oxohepta-3-ene-1,7-dioic acid hydratase in catechol pathway